MNRCRAVLFLALSLTGCALFQKDAIADKENTLAAAGFLIRPIASTEQAVLVAKLPPDRISQRVEGANVTYIYPDPVNCHCVYFGGQAAYGRYQQIAIQKNIARDQIDAAQLNADFGWDWGPWGGYGPAFY